LKAKKGDIFLLVTNPAILPPWVGLFSFFKDIKFIILVYDIYPDVLISSKIISTNGLFARLYKKLNLVTFKRAEVVITLGYRMANLLASGDNALKNKIFVVPPWIDSKSIVPISKAVNPETSNYIPEDKIVVLYSGNFGVSHDIESILEAAYLLKDDPQIFFLLFGGGEKFKMAESFVSKNKLSNINIWPFQPYDKIKYTLPLGDIAIVSVNEGMEDLILPSKAFSYMAAGSALIGISNEPSELGELFKMGNFGIIVKPKSPETLANPIKELVNDKIRLTEMRREARFVVEKFYSREVGVNNFIDILENSDLFKK
jgi:glycosyltransferase involved in cell wall biosynthesis